MLQHAQRENYREFYEQVARRYPEEELVYASLRGRVRRRFILSHLRSFRGRLLDLGCNRGMYTATYQNGKAFGVDIALPALVAARERHPGGRYIQGDAQDLSFFRSQSFDAILCSELIEHVPDAQRVINECFRLLRKGGRLLLTTPNYKGTRPTWVDIGAMQAFGVSGVRGQFYFHTAFRPEELAEMAGRAGFQQVDCGTFEKEVKYATRLPVALFHLVRVLNRATFNSAQVNRVNGHLLERGALVVYLICRGLGLDGLFTRLVREGVRSYLLASKL